MPDDSRLRIQATPSLRPLGSATPVARKILHDIRASSAEVPCQACTACCRAGYEVELMPDEAARLPYEPSPTDGKPILPRRDDGTCALLVNDRCSVYTARPQVCRTYDCRIFALAGMFPSQLLERSDFQAFNVTTHTRDDHDVAMATKMAAFVAHQQGHDVDIAARIGVLQHGQYLPLARQIGDAITTQPAVQAQLHASMQQVHAAVTARGGTVDVPLRASLPGNAPDRPENRARRLTRRALLWHGRSRR